MPPLQMFWFLPTAGDGHYLATSRGARAVDLNYLREIAHAADYRGFDGCLLPTGRGYEDTWVTAAAVIPDTKRMKLLVAVRPGLMSPTLSARMAATFDRLSNGRLLVNVVCSGDPVENHGDGLFLDHDARYAAADEFLDIWTQLCHGETVTVEGQHMSVKEASLTLPPVQRPHPRLYLGGSSEAALRVAAKHIDCFLTWGEPPAMVAEKVDRMRAMAAEQGRTIGFGIRLHVIVRETEAEAWDDAAKLIKYVDEAAVAKARAVWARQDSVGQQRMAQLQSGGRDGLVVYPNLWAGVGLVRGGAGTALVGNPEQVAGLMREYADLGIDTFILSGYPHLEEAHRVADLLFPLVKPNAGVGTVAASGEAIADTYHPGATHR